jgi:hypothetical protein
VQLAEAPALVVDPGAFLSREERATRHEHRHLRRAPGGVRVAERERALGAVHGSRGRLDVDPQLVDGRAQPVERQHAAQLREEGRQAAVVAGRPECVDQLLAGDRPQSVRDEKREQQPALPSR